MAELLDSLELAQALPRRRIVGCSGLQHMDSLGPRALWAMAMLTPQTHPLSFGGAEMRVAETRAVNRALRKAYGIGLCSVVQRLSRRSL